MSLDEKTFIFIHNQNRTLSYTKWNDRFSYWSSLTYINGIEGNINSCCLTSDSLRGVVCNNICYFFIWTGTDYSGVVRTLDRSNRNYNNVDMTSDGSILVACSGFVYYAIWNGTNYSEFIQTLANDASRVSITPDGSRIIYCNGNNVYWSAWIGNNFGPGTLISNNVGPGANIKISPDGNIIYYIVHNSDLSTLYYSVWTGTNYSYFIPVFTSELPININPVSLTYSNNSLYILVPSVNLYKISVTITDSSVTVYDQYASKVAASRIVTDNIINSNIAIINQNINAFNNVSQINLSDMTLSFSNYTIVATFGNEDNITYAMSSDEQTCIILSYTYRKIYYSKYNDNSWSSIIFFANLPINAFSCCLTSDGSRGVLCGGNSDCYFFSWTGTGYTDITHIKNETSRNYFSVDISADGKLLVACGGNIRNRSDLYYSIWNGTKYSPFTRAISEELNPGKVTITATGNRIVFSSGNNIYWASWTGSNFGSATLINNKINLNPITPSRIKLSVDGNILYIYTDPNYNRFISITENATIYYSLWNGTTYTQVKPISYDAIPFMSNYNINGISTSNSTNSLYVLGGGVNNSINLYKTILIF